VVSELFDPDRWREVGEVADLTELTDLTYHRAVDPASGADLPVVRVAFDRPEIRNAFRPHTVDELLRVLEHARTSSDVGCVLLTGNGPSPRDGGWAFCSGGDQRIRGRDGYRYTGAPGEETAAGIDPARSGRLHILEVQRLIRMMPKAVICVVPGWAAGGGHSLHVVCDLTIASRQRVAVLADLHQGRGGQPLQQRADGRRGGVLGQDQRRGAPVPAPRQQVTGRRPVDPERVQFGHGNRLLRVVGCPAVAYDAAHPPTGSAPWSPSCSTPTAGGRWERSPT